MSKVQCLLYRGMGMNFCVNSTHYIGNPLDYIIHVTREICTEFNALENNLEQKPSGVSRIAFSS